MRLHWILFVTTNSQTKQTNRGVERGERGRGSIGGGDKGAGLEGTNCCYILAIEKNDAARFFP